MISQQKKSDIRKCTYLYTDVLYVFLNSISWIIVIMIYNFLNYTYSNMQNNSTTGLKMQNNSTTGLKKYGQFFKIGYTFLLLECTKKKIYPICSCFLKIILRINCCTILNSVYYLRIHILFKRILAAPSYLGYFIKILNIFKHTMSFQSWIQNLKSSF